MYRITARQILVIALGSAVFASVAVLGFQKLAQRFSPAQAELSLANPANIADPATVTDEQNNIEVYKAVSPGVVYIQSTTMVRDFFGFSEEQKHHTTFTYDIDHPEQFASQDIGATPVELVLVGLAGCLTAGVAAVATQRAVKRILPPRSHTPVAIERRRGGQRPRARATDVGRR